jgi:hypothetical protein
MIKTSLIIASLIAIGIFTYFLTIRKPQEGFLGDPQSQNQSGTNNLQNNSLQKSAIGNATTNESHEVFSGRIHNADFEDLNSPCPTRASNFRRLLNCPRISSGIFSILKKLNYQKDEDDCEIESRTVNFTLGKDFIAWTLVHRNSCENRAYPHGLPEEMTYNLKDASEVEFSQNFDLQKLEKHYLARVDFNNGRDNDGKKCPRPGQKSRLQALGTLGSELTKGQFRLVDNTKVVNLKMQTFFLAPPGRVCHIPLVVQDWRLFLKKDSRYQLNSKPNAIFNE